MFIHQFRTSTSTPTYSTPEDLSAVTGGLAMVPSQFLGGDPFGMLPMPESPVPSQSAPRFSHRPSASVSSGPHYPPSPLSQAPLVSRQDEEPAQWQSKGKGRAE